MIVLLTSIVVFTGTNIFLHFMMRGSYLLLILVAVLAILAMISLGLAFASRFKSEELANGLMNLVTLPMILLSGVFFPLDDAPPALKVFSNALPLTQFVDGARKIMLEGAGITTIFPNLIYLMVMTAFFLLLSSFLFKWE